MRKITDFDIVDREAAELSEMIQNQKSILMTYHWNWITHKPASKHNGMQLNHVIMVEKFQ